MSTDIGALEKQYARLRRKQHHACVVISGIKPGNPDQGLKSDKGKSEEMTVAGSIEPEEYVEDSITMMTLSVPMETEKGRQDVTDPVSPTVFGDTKCIFIQNKKTKRPKEKEKLMMKHSSHVRKATKHPGDDVSALRNTLKQADDLSTCKNTTSSTENELRKETRTDPEQHRTEECLRTENNKDSATEDIDSMNETQLKETNSNEDNTVKEANKDLENNNNTPGNQEIEPESVDKAECLTPDKNAASEHMEHSNIHYNQENENKSVGGNESPKPNETKTNEENTVKKSSEEKEINSSVQDNQAIKNQSVDENEPSNEKHDNCPLSNNTRQSGNEVLRHPLIKFSKQYYPSRKLSSSKKRTNSVESANKQSIYQHFTMTKRQLSLDSGLHLEHNMQKPAKNIEFPFPVHSINEHKIKAGMKLGLYDQKALEKMEKTQPRKTLKMKLPNLKSD